MIGTKGIPTTAGSKILEGLRSRLRLDGGGAVRRARPAPPRQDEHGRVRDGLVHRELGVRSDSQPLGSDRVPGGSGGARPRRSRKGWPVGARLGHGRIGQAARRSVRRRRAPAHLRDGVTVRNRRFRFQPRPDRACREDRGRLRFSTRSSRAAIRATRRRSTFRTPWNPIAEDLRSVVSACRRS